MLNPLVHGTSSSSKSLAKTHSQLPLVHRHHRSSHSSNQIGGRLNMRSALAHSLADLLRSCATIASSLLGLWGFVDARTADGACALGFSVVIGAGGCAVGGQILRAALSEGAGTTAVGRGEGAVKLAPPVVV